MKAIIAALQMRCAAALASIRRRLMPAPYAALELGTASWVSYALAAFCELGLPEALAESPKDVHALHLAGYGDEKHLTRLLRALAAYDVVRVASDGRWSLARSGRALHGSNSIAPMIRYANAPWHAAGYHHLAQAVQTSEAGFLLAQGEPLFTYLGTRPDASALFDAAMRGMNALFAKPFVETLDLSRVATICDVGGGDGALMECVAAAYPRIEPLVFDLPHVVANAKSDRVKFTGGDIFHEPPPPADCYVLSHVLHDWNDDACTVILRNVRRAMTPAARLFLCEMVVDERRNAWAPDRVSDIEMLAMLGGKERTRAEFEALLTAAGLRLVAVRHAAAPEAAIECVPAETPNR